MKLKDLISMLAVDGRFVITALAYEKETKKYYSFRTVLDIEPKCFDRRALLTELSEEELACEVKVIAQYGNEVWIDIIEWID